MKVDELQQLIGNDEVLLVDIRDPSDQLKGVVKEAKCLTVDALISQAENLIRNHQRILVMCYRGVTSKSICESLGDHFYSIEGGFEACMQKGLAIELPQLNESDVRYQQQIKLAGFGIESQQKLAQSHVLVVGAGGLGSPALLYLVASGVGTITLVDDDEVSLSNLHRQILYQEQDIGQKKAEQARKRLSQLNSTIKIDAVCERLNENNAKALIAQSDLVIDGTDNINTRYLINDCCNKVHVPWIFAAVSAFDIQLAMFGHKQSELCYRCLFPEMTEGDAGNCSMEGVLGSVPGIAALLQATEAIKYLTNLGDNLRNKMLNYNVLNHHFKVLKYPPQQTCIHK